MDLDKLVNTITPDIYDRLKKAVELGRWENGVKLTGQQVSDSLQLLIAYDEKNKPAADRIGYIQPKEHQHCGSEEDEWQPLDIKDS
ncbi:MAG: DUF1315 family protein [Porticoccaceae bacterium]